MTLPILIVGGSNGGLTTALYLQARGSETHMFEEVSQVKPPGVGINLLPQAARLVHELELAYKVSTTAIQTGKLEYYNKFGQLIWSEPRGLAAGYAVPQYSIHRGDLQMLLYEAAIERLGRERIVTNAT